MFLSIYNNRSGEEYIRRLSPTEKLTLREHVQEWMEREGYCDAALKPVFSEPGSHIANGCGEWQAEIRDTKKVSGSCWTSEPFFMVGEDE